MKSSSRIIITLFSMLFASLMYAGELTENSVQKWIKAFPEVNAWMEEREDVMDSIKEDIDFSGMRLDEMISASMEAIKGHEIYGDFEKMLKKKGYKSGEEFLKTTVTIMQSMGAMAMDQEMGGVKVSEMVAEMKQRMAEIDAQEMFSDEQKEKMKEQMKAAMEQITGMVEAFGDIDEDNLEVVKPFFEKIKSVLDDAQ